MTNFQLKDVQEQQDGSTLVRFSVTLEPPEWVAANTAILESSGTWQPEFELRGEAPLPRETPPLGQIPFYDTPSVPTRREFEAVARFQPVNEETVLAAFQKALQRT